MVEMNKLIVLVGLPASGKSTYAKEHLENKNTVILSSDKLREELLGDERCQDNNDLIFRTLYKRAKEELQNGKNVVIDATNINIKARRSTLSNFVKMDIERIAIVFATPFEVCIARDKERERTVGEEVIKKFFYRFEIPMEYEGFDKVTIVKDGHYYIHTLFDNMRYFDQKNYHHKYSLGEHCMKCYEYIKELTDNESLINSAQLHDIGKLYTQTFEEDGVAHYYSHHNVGAYVVMCSNYQYNSELLFYINFHMQPFFWKEEKTFNKYRKLFGDKLYDNLMLLHKCDKKASGTHE